MIGKRIKELRGNQNITQEELSKRLGVSTSMVGMYETEARNPSYEVLLRIADYFNVSTDYILGNTGFKFHEEEEIKGLELLVDAISSSKNDEISGLSKEILELLQLTTYNSIAENRVRELSLIKKLYHIVYKIQNTLSTNAYKKYMEGTGQVDIANILMELRDKFNALSEEIACYYFDEASWREDFSLDVEGLLSLTEEMLPPLRALHGDIVKIPVLGKIPAGNPIEAEENIIDYVDISKSELSSSDLYFYLIVTGDSMIGSGIMDGYRVLVKKQPDVENGEIAVIRVNSSEATLKRVKKIDGQVILYPDNPKYDPIFITNNDAEIIGKVVKVEFDPNKKY